MTIAYAAYVILTGLMGFFLLPFIAVCFKLSGRSRLFQRFGFYSEDLKKRLRRKPTVWIHAASVGEVSVAAPVIQSVRSQMPSCSIIVSVVTPHGLSYAEKAFDKDIVCMYAPVDIFFCIRKSLSTFQPDVLVLMETEIWPAWIYESHRRGVKLALINGRISSRSIQRYLSIRFLIAPLLKYIDAFSMISTADAGRIRLMGAPGHRIFVNGNAKHDRLTQTSDASISQKMAELFQINDLDTVWIAGSTRTGEEGILLDVYQELIHVVPNMVMIIAPRHVERSETIRRLVISKGFSCQFRTDLDHQSRHAPIVILNTIGELQAAYSIADIVFCGGSLVPLGGQNILEPAAWGKPVFYGPSMDDFEDAREILEKTGGGIQVKNGSDLAQKMIELLKNPVHCKEIGLCAEKAFKSSGGASKHHANIICRLISNQQHGKNNDDHKK